MATGSASDSQIADRDWYIVGRWQEYEGEARANLLRIIGIAAFYTVQLINYHGLRIAFLELPKVEDVTRSFHQVITALAVAWTMVALGVQLCLQIKFFPGGLKFVSTTCDVFLLTAILIVADGPRSPMVVVYLLLITLATLRFSLPLIWYATAGSAMGYLVVLGFARWFTERAIRVDRYQQIIFILALVLTGVTMGQVVRRLRRAAEAYAERRGVSNSP